jgi:hypothetical protein
MRFINQGFSTIYRDDDKSYLRYFILSNLYYILPVYVRKIKISKSPFVLPNEMGWSKDSAHSFLDSYMIL